MVNQISNRERFLMTILNGGLGDLELLDNVNYEWRDILQNYQFVRYDINRIMRAVVEFGIGKLTSSIDDRIRELEAHQDDEISSEKSEELHALQQLSPYNDIQADYNSVATSVWAAQHAETYRKYLFNELDDFENGTGFQIEIE